MLLRFAIIATCLSAQTPSSEKAKSKAGHESNPKVKKSESGQPPSTNQSTPEQNENVQNPPQPAPLASPSVDEVTAKREVARRSVEALHSAIQFASRSGIDAASIKAQEEKLQAQLTEAKDDSAIDEITTKAGLLAEITKDWPKPQTRPGGNAPLALSIFALVFSVIAMTVGPILCYSQTRAAITKALKSAGLI